VLHGFGNFRSTPVQRLVTGIGFDHLSREHINQIAANALTGACVLDQDQEKMTPGDFE
jgi:hypothetical protein